MPGAAADLAATIHSGCEPAEHSGQNRRQVTHRFAQVAAKPLAGNRKTSIVTFFRPAAGRGPRPKLGLQVLLKTGMLFASEGLRDVR
jgi:hypothetical protein